MKKQIPNILGLLILCTLAVGCVVPTPPPVVRTAAPASTVSPSPSVTIVPEFDPRPVLDALSKDNPEVAFISMTQFCEIFNKGNDEDIPAKFRESYVNSLRNPVLYQKAVIACTLVQLLDLPPEDKSISSEGRAWMCTLAEKENKQLVEYFSVQFGSELAGKFNDSKLVDNKIKEACDLAHKAGSETLEKIARLPVPPPVKSGSLDEPIKASELGPLCILLNSDDPAKTLLASNKFDLSTIKKFEATVLKRRIDAYCRLHQQLKFPKNECQAKDPTQPFYDSPPYWWFVLTFKPHQTGNLTYSFRYLGADKSGDKPVSLQSPDIETEKAGQAEKDPTKKRPWACVVAYIVDKEDKDLVPFLSYQPCEPIGANVQWEEVNDIATFDGQDHVTCNVNMIYVADVTAGKLNKADQFAESYTYTTFWFKAKGTLADVSPGRKPLMYYQAIDHPESSFGLAVANSVPDTSGANAKILSRFGVAESGSGDSFLAISNADQIWGVRFNPNDTKIKNWWSYVVPSLGASPSSPPPLGTDGNPQPSPIQLGFWPIGTFYIGYDPNTTTHLKGTVDEIIADPGDQHG